MKLYDAVKQIRFNHANKSISECVNYVILSGNFNEQEVVDEITELKKEYALWLLGNLDIDEDKINTEIKSMWDLLGTYCNGC